MAGSPHSLLLEIFTDKGIGTEIVHGNSDLRVTGCGVRAHLSGFSAKCAAFVRMTNLSPNPIEIRNRFEMTAPSIVRTSTAELYDAHVLKNYARAPLTLVRGRGTQVWDDAGNSYLDFTSGIAVSALGHCHPHWVAAVQRQAGELIHVSNLFRNPHQGELARRM